MTGFLRIHTLGSTGYVREGEGIWDFSGSMNAFNVPAAISDVKWAAGIIKEVLGVYFCFFELNSMSQIIEKIIYFGIGEPEKCADLSCVKFFGDVELSVFFGKCHHGC